MPRNRRKPRPPHVAERTQMRRPLHNLSQDEVKRAKAMRDDGMLFADIAQAMGYSVRDVELALFNTRSPNPENPQACIWTNRDTVGRLRKMELPDETRGQTLERLMDEHAHFQRLFGR